MSALESIRRRLKGLRKIQRDYHRKSESHEGLHEKYLAGFCFGVAVSIRHHRLFLGRLYKLIREEERDAHS